MRWAVYVCVLLSEAKLRVWAASQLQGLFHVLHIQLSLFLSALNLYPGAYLTSVFVCLVGCFSNLFVNKLLISERRCRSRQPHGCWASLGSLNTNLQELPWTCKNLDICIWMFNQRHKFSMTRIKLLIPPTTPNLFFPPISPHLSKWYCHLPSCPSQPPRNYPRFFFFIPTTSNPLAKVGDSTNKISWNHSHFSCFLCFPYRASHHHLHCAVAT